MMGNRSGIVRMISAPFWVCRFICSNSSAVNLPGFCRMSSRMLILPGGPFVGRLSAGCIEEEISNLAFAVIDHGKPAKCFFDLRSRFACDGSIVVFVERLEKPNQFLDALTGVLDNRTPITVSTNYRSADAT